MWQRLHSPLQKKKPPRAYSPQTVLYQSVPLPRMRLPLFPFPPRQPFHRQDPPTPRLTRRLNVLTFPLLHSGARYCHSERSEESAFALGELSPPAPHATFQMLQRADVSTLYAAIRIRVNRRPFSPACCRFPHPAHCAFPTTVVLTY